MSNSKTKGTAVALVLAMTLTSCVAPLRSAIATDRSSVLPPFARLYRSLGERPSVYYLVSPEIVTSAFNIRDVNIDGRVKQLKLGTGYVMVYGEHERLSGRALLAKQNMKIIRSHLVAPSPPMPKGSTVDSLGLPEIGALAEAMSNVCHLKFTNRLSSRLIVPTAGKKLGLAQSCIGFGIAAALAGYRIEPVKEGLEFRRVLAVKQGSAVQESGSLRGL